MLSESSESPERCLDEVELEQEDREDREEEEEEGVRVRQRAAAFLRKWMCLIYALSESSANAVRRVRRPIVKRADGGSVEKVGRYYLRV